MLFRSHTGGVASADDITQGLPRVVELFEARTPKGHAQISEAAGRVQIEETDKARIIVVTPDDGSEVKEYPVSRRSRLLVEDGGRVEVGDKFTADAYTGIDPMLGGALDSLLDLATQKLGETLVGGQLPDLGDVNLVQRLLGVSGDFTTLYGVNYMGVSFGASNINAFIGAGKPDFSRPLADQGLIGFGLQDLDLGFGIYNPQLPGIWGMLFKDTVKPIATLKASVSELGAYGFGDFLKILGRDIELLFNDGGFWGPEIQTPVGPIQFLRANPIYSGIVNRKVNPDGTITETKGHIVGTGSDPVIFDFAGPPLMGLDIGLAEISLADFVHLRGSLAFQIGRAHV